MLLNADFEQDWSDESSHRVSEVVGGVVTKKDVGNIFTPPGWGVWYSKYGECAQPECRDTRAHDPDRMHSGEKGYLIFTFSKTHHAGLYQKIKVGKGSKVRFTVWAHAWSNHRDDSLPEKFPHPDEPGWSEGAGFDAFFALDTADGLSDELRNFTFWVGIDPTGGTNPTASTVVWGPGAHIYNNYAQVPAVEVVAEADEVTVFTRSRAKYPFKHNDAYYDSAGLEVEVPVIRGAPRVQYERTYVLLPPTANLAWVSAIVDATWDDKRWTIGQSADDAGIGDLDKRRVIAVNPHLWPDVLTAEWYDEHYSGVEYVEIAADIPDQLFHELRELVNGETPDPTPDPSPGPTTNLKLEVGLHDDNPIEGLDVMLIHRQVQTEPITLDFSGTLKLQRVICRLNWGYADGTGTIPPQRFADRWVDTVLQTIWQSRGVYGWIIGNEINNPVEWPGGAESPSFIVYPGYYIDLYNQIRGNTSEEHLIAPSPIDPYNVVAGVYSQPADPMEWAHQIYRGIDGLDFIALHSKTTQGWAPWRVLNDAKFTDPPLQDRFLEFRSVEDQLKWIPDYFDDRPVFVTEANPHPRWDGGTGAEWIKAACDYLRGLNRISGAMFYRYDLAGDQAKFGLADKPEILEAIKGEVTL